jgi:hypothetical protein
MADANELQETSIPDEETVQETETETTDSEVDIEDLKAKAAKAEEYKKYADRVAAENKELKKASKAEVTINQQSPPVTREDYERLDLKTEGYKSEEVDFLMQNGGRKALDNPIVMAGIDAMRKKQKSQEATPSGTAKSAVYQKFTEADLKKMPLEELEKIVPQ